MNNITKLALRKFILSNSDESSEYDRGLALDELLADSIANVHKYNLPMSDFVQYRRTHGRIETIKYVRASLNVGLLEALIIVKGIESHYDMV